MNKCYELKVVKKGQSVYHGTESITYLGPKIWDIPPEKSEEH